MLENIAIGDIVFIDVETVPMVSGWCMLPEDYKRLWERKSAYFRTSEQTAEDVWERAGIYAEFGRVICVSAAKYYMREEQPVVRIKSYSGDDEREVLQDLANMLIAYGSKKDYTLCAHNGKEFDFPFLARRMLVNGIKLPDILNVAGMKPWEVNLLDTMQLWKFGDYKHYTSLELLAMLFDIPTPKDQMDGSMVAAVYYEEKGLDRIVRYCEKDALTVVQLFLRFKGLPLLKDDQVELVH